MLCRRSSVPALVLVCALAACSPPEVAVQWPGFRGPGGMGLFDDAGMPVTWSADDGSVLWKTEIPGRGNSSPVVADGRVFLTTAFAEGEGPANLVREALALDLESGEILWQTEIYRGEKERLHRENTSAGPSPVTDGRHVFVTIGTHLAKLDLDGRIVWSHEVHPDYVEHSRYGAASSLALTRDAVIVLRDRESAEPGLTGWLAAFSRADGSELWRHEWGDICCTYSTPVVVDRGAGEEVLVALTHRLKSFDAGTGEHLWSAEYEINQLVGGPVLEGDLLIVAGGAHNVRESAAFRLAGAGAGTRVEKLWNTVRYAPQTSSAVLYEGLIYTMTTKGMVACRDAWTGETLWDERLQLRSPHAALLAGDGKVYSMSPVGQTAVMAAGREFELLAMNSLPEETNKWAGASPAVADGTLLVRGARHLYRIGHPPGGGEAAPAAAE